MSISNNLPMKLIVIVDRAVLVNKFLFHFPTIVKVYNINEIHQRWQRKLPQHFGERESSNLELKTFSHWLNVLFICCFFFKLKLGEASINVFLRKMYTSFIPIYLVYSTVYNCCSSSTLTKLGLVAHAG